MERFEEHRSRIQLLVLDVDLPKRYGDDCLRESRAAGVNVPSIFVTASAEADLEHQLDENCALLRKPFQLRYLSAPAENLLNLRQPRETPA